MDLHNTWELKSDLCYEPNGQLQLALGTGSEDSKNNPLDYYFDNIALYEHR